MPLALYSEYIFLPGGNPAANMPIPIGLVGANQVSPLFADKPGTIPLANPVMSDADGRIQFYGAPGRYFASLAGESTLIPVDAAETDDVWPGVYVHDQAVPATVWTIDHHFGLEPAVTVLVGGARVEAEVTHPTAEQTVITFSPAQAGTAFLRR